MPTPPYPNIPPNFGLARVRFNLNGALHDPFVIYGYKDTASPLDQQAAADNAFSAWSTLMTDFSSQMGIQQVTVVENQGGTLVEAGSTAAPVSGGASGAAVPPNTSLLIHKSTGLIGKHFRGRIYMPGLPIAVLDTSGESVKATPLASYQTDFNTLLTDLATFLVPMYLLHRSVSVVPTLVSALAVEERVATQSRRLRKVAHR